MHLLSRVRETCALILLMLVALAVPTQAAAQASFPPAPTVKMAVNPVTNKVYTLNEFANTVSVFDATAGTIKTIAVGARPQYIAINPVTNRVYVNNGSDATLSIIDGATDTNLTVPALGIGSTGPISVDPVHNIIYIVRLTTAASDEVTFFNGDTNTWYTVATASFQPIAMAVNPVTSTIYVAHYATGDIRIISGAFNPANDFPATTSIGMWSKPFAIAVNPVTNKVYVVIDDSRGPIGIVDGASQTAQFPLPAAGHAVGPKGLAVNTVTNKIYALFSGEVVVIDGATNAYTYIPVATGSGQAEIAVNPVTNKVYVASDGGALTVIDGGTNAATALTIPSSANALGLDPVRNVAYVFGTGLTAVNGSASDVQHATLLTTSITPLANNASGANATFTLNASTAFTPQSMPPNRVYVQLDSRTGPWLRAGGSGPFTASFSGMADGSHTLYAFAADGQDAPLSSGDVTILPGTMASYTFTVSGNKLASSVSLSSSQNPSVVGQSVTFTASIAGGTAAPTGTVDFLDGTVTIPGCSGVAVASGSAACTTAGLASGSHSITARYSGDSTYTAATSGAINQSVGAASASVVLATSRTPAPAGSTVTFTATVSGNAAAPTGSVTFRDGGTAIAACTSVALSGGAASCNAAFDTGTHNITAAYSGDSVYGAAISGTLPQTITAVTPNTFLSSSANPSRAGDSVTFTITLFSDSGTPTGSVDFLDGGAAISGCTSLALASGSATCATASLAAGTHSITVRYGGDARFGPVTSATLSQTVQAQATQTAAMSLSTTAIDFGGQSMGTTSPDMQVVVTNTGNAALTVSGVSTSDAQFAQANDCSTVAPGGTCAIHVTFTPTPTGIALGASASVSGTLSITTNASGSPGTVSLAGSAEKSLVTHFYRAILRRAPDDAGKSFWTGESLRMQQLGANPNETWFAMAAAFYFSPEYLSLARDDAGFVSDLYLTFFNRAADSSGLSFWTGQLAGGMPRENVLASFMFSPEFGAFTQGIFGNTAARAEVNLVMDFYRGVLGRLPDSSGFSHWVQQFRTAQCQGAGAVYAQADAISAAFLDGAEYANRQRANGQYVGDLYNAFLRRGGDLSGVRYWIDQLNSSAMSREQERASFIATPEFSDRVNAVVSQGCQP